MGFFNWINSLLRPSSRPLERDVSGLSGTDALETVEVIEREVGPLKPSHRRLTLRDSRLLPKPKPKVTSYVWPRPKKPIIMPYEEASRFFADTLRTSNRNIRDLATDPEQLTRYGLPLWNSEADVAAALGITVGQLRHYSFHRQRETSCHYVTFAIAKRTGGQRLIHAPKKRLKAIQRKLNQLLIQRLPMSDRAHGFRAGRSIGTNALAHVGKRVVIKLDLADCFPTIHYARVRGLLIALGYNYAVATALAVLATEPPRQPVAVGDKLYHVPVGPRVCVQGAPTSPGLCNAVLMRMDRRLAGLAKKHGFAYTRYADDLAMSGDDNSKVAMLVAIARRIVEEEGFHLNAKKTRVLRRGRRQQVAGVVVNDQPGLSRTDRRRLRAAIHQLKPGDQAARRRLAGKLAYLHMLNPDQARPLQQSLAARA